MVLNRVSAPPRFVRDRSGTRTPASAVLRQIHLQAGAEGDEARAAGLGAGARLAVVLPGDVRHHPRPGRGFPGRAERGGAGAARTDVGGARTHARVARVRSAVVESHRIEPGSNFDLAPPHARPSLTAAEGAGHGQAPPGRDGTRQVLEVQSLFVALLVHAQELAVHAPRPRLPLHIATSARAQAVDVDLLEEAVA